MISVILTVLLLPVALLVALLLATWDQRPRGYAATKPVDLKKIELPRGPATGAPSPPPLPSGVIPWSSDPAISERVDWP